MRSFIDAPLREIAPSTLIAGYAVRSTMAALGAHVGAKLQCNIAWVRHHEPDDHRPRAHGAKGGRHSRQPLLRSHCDVLSSFRRNYVLIRPINRARRRSRQRRVIRTELAGAVDGEQLRKPLARAIDPALATRAAFANEGPRRSFRCDRRRIRRSVFPSHAGLGTPSGFSFSASTPHKIASTRQQGRLGRANDAA